MLSWASPLNPPSPPLRLTWEHQLGAAARPAMFCRLFEEIAPEHPVTSRKTKTPDEFFSARKVFPKRGFVYRTQHYVG